MHALIVTSMHCVLWKWFWRQRRPAVDRWWLVTIVPYIARSSQAGKYNALYFSSLFSTVFAQSSRDGRRNHNFLLPCRLYTWPWSVGHRLTDCHFRIWTQRVTYETWDPSDNWSEWWLDKRQKDKKTKKDKKDKMTKRQRQKREFNNVTSGQFRTHAMF